MDFFLKNMFLKRYSSSYTQRYFFLWVTPLRHHKDISEAKDYFPLAKQYPGIYTVHLQINLK